MPDTDGINDGCDCSYAGERARARRGRHRLDHVLTASGADAPAHRRPHRSDLRLLRVHPLRVPARHRLDRRRLELVPRSRRQGQRRVARHRPQPRRPSDLRPYPRAHGDRRVHRGRRGPAGRGTRGDGALGREDVPQCPALLPRRDHRVYRPDRAPLGAAFHAGRARGVARPCRAGGHRRPQRPPLPGPAGQDDPARVGDRSDPRHHVDGRLRGRARHGRRADRAGPGIAAVPHLRVRRGPGRHHLAGAVRGARSRGSGL